MGFEIVRVLLSGDKRPKLQVMIERRVDQGLSLENCTEASRAISAILDVEDPIAGAFILEVSSPGIDRPLTRLGDFERFAGFEARLETNMPVDGRKRFAGRLLGTVGSQVRLALDDGEVDLEFDDLVKAKLVMTDELVAASQVN